MPNISSRVGLCLICLMLMPGCNASKNHQKDDSADSTDVDSLTMKNDSLPPPLKPGPAPGHARIQAELVDIAKTSPKYMTITFLVTKVEGYGASTPPLAIRDSVKVRAGKSVIDEQKISLGKIVSAVISYRQVVLGDDPSPRWTLVTLD